MRHISFSDHLEKEIAQALDAANIAFVHESEDNNQPLDFYLPDFNVFLEIKQFHAERISRQMSLKDNVIAIQGKVSVAFFVKMLQQLQAPPTDSLNWDKLYPFG